MRLSRMVPGVFAVVCSAAVALAGDVSITEISIHRVGESVDVAVHGTGPLTVTPKMAGKSGTQPFRLILDFPRAVRAFKGQSFNSLPTATLSAIRTSQYAVTPEKVVRVVLDFAARPNYQIEQRGSAIVIHLPATPDEPNFPVWSTATVGTAPAPVPTLAATPEPEKAVPPLTEPAATPLEPDTAALEQGETQPETSAAEGKENDTSAVASEEMAPADSQPLEPDATTAATPETTAGQAAAAEPTLSPGETLTSMAPAPADTSAESQPVRDKLFASAESLPSPPAPGANHLTASASNSTAVAPQQPAHLLPSAASTPETTGKAVSQAEPPAPKKSSPAPPVKTPAGSAPAAEPTPPEVSVTDLTEPQGPTPAEAEEEVTEEEINPDEVAVEEDSTEENFAPIPGVMLQTSPTRTLVKYHLYGRDPFSPLVEKAVGLSGKHRGRLPDVEALRLVGILRGWSGSRALFEDREGRGYILRDGDRVRNGHVVSVSDRKVVFQINEYGWTRTVALTLLSDENE